MPIGRVTRLAKDWHRSRTSFGESFAEAVRHRMPIGRVTRLAKD